MVAPLPSLPETVARFGLESKKALGQHFLLDISLCEQIAALAGNLAGVHVIEIGAGPGGLTRALLTTPLASLSVVETDARAIPALELLQPHSGQRLHIYHEDALALSLLERVPAPRAVVANLPYNIGSELLLRWLDEIEADSRAYQSLTLMFQKEVGERLVAQPFSKAYGRLSILAQWLCEVHLLLDIPKEAFSPPPKVESVVVQLLPRAKPLYDVPRAALERVLHVAFQQRRKMLRSALKPLGITQEKLEALGIDAALRPDQLTIAHYAQLAQAVCAPHGQDRSGVRV